MDIARIEALIGLLSRSDLSELELREGEWLLRLRRDPGPAGPAGAASAPPAGGGDGFDVGSAAALATGSAGGQPTGAPTAVPGSAGPASEATGAADAAVGGLVRAPMFGVLCLAPGAGKPAFVAVGDHVGKGQTLCLIEVMKMFHAVESEVDGTVREILARNGDEVDVDQPLFRIG
jgi:acetyl-CoA carboxylase biotin carboxyl carrier protein